MTTRSPVTFASRNTLRRWFKSFLRQAGVGLAVFSPHSTRSASSSETVLKLPLAPIAAAVGWASVSPFGSFSLGDLCDPDTRVDDVPFARAVLE